MTREVTRHGARNPVQLCQAARDLILGRVAELDEVRTQSPTVDDLLLQRCCELTHVDDAQMYQEMTEMHGDWQSNSASPAWAIRYSTVTAREKQPSTPGLQLSTTM